MMLWVNLIMDTMGALALGTEEPTLELLNRCAWNVMRSSQINSIAGLSSLPLEHDPSSTQPNH
jgi:hypothetical protein